MTEAPILRLRRIRGKRPMAFVLCDGAGTIIPCQRAVNIDQHYDKPAIVTVEFIVDNRRFVIEEDYLPSEAPPMGP